MAGAVLGGVEVDTWVGESWSAQVTARTTEALLVFADATSGDAVSVFDVDHRESACASDDGSSGGPWSERPMFDVDWSFDLSGSDTDLPDEMGPCPEGEDQPRS